MIRKMKIVNSLYEWNVIRSYEWNLSIWTNSIIFQDTNFASWNISTLFFRNKNFKVVKEKFRRISPPFVIKTGFHLKFVTCYADKYRVATKEFQGERTQMLIGITASFNQYKLGEPLLICYSFCKIWVWNNSLKTCFCNSDTTLSYSKSVPSSVLLLTEN